MENKLKGHTYKFMATYVRENMGEDIVPSLSYISSSIESLWSYLKVLYIEDIEVPYELIRGKSSACRSFLNLYSDTKSRDVFLKVISESISGSYNWARFDIGKPFPLGEHSIAKSARYSILYAKYVLGSRFPEGEVQIMKEGKGDRYLNIIDKLD